MPVIELSINKNQVVLSAEFYYSTSIVDLEIYRDDWRVLLVSHAMKCVRISKLTG